MIISSMMIIDMPLFVRAACVTVDETAKEEMMCYSCTAMPQDFCLRSRNRPKKMRFYRITLKLLLIALCMQIVQSFSVHYSLPSMRRCGFDTVGAMDSSVVDNDEDATATSNRVRDVAIVSPLLDEGYPRVVEEHETAAIYKKPLLLYLPGFDGTWIAPFLQYPELSTIFDVRCLTVGMSDRSTFDELKENVIEYILAETQLENRTLRDENETTMHASNTVSSRRKGNFLSNLVPFNKNSAPSKNGLRNVYLMGESFGGILASEVAVTLLNEQNAENVKGLVLINPATCYDRSRFASEATKVVNLPKFLYPLGLMRLIPLFSDEYALPQLILMLQSKKLPSVIDSTEREAYMGRVAFSLPQKLKYMPQETLEWRLFEWLGKGSAHVEGRLQILQNLNTFRTLIVAGEKDLTLPSIAEAERLSNIFPNSHVHVVEGAGHANTCGSRVDLAALMRARFKELRYKGKRGKKFGRIAMKLEAAQGEGIHFGMESRYNGREEGLSPLLYWTKHVYRKPPAKTK